MRSFDIFDTLIARKCIWPQAIFSLVEQRIGSPGFATLRIRAEAELQGTEHTLDDIYRRMISNGGMDVEFAERARTMELATELENVIPIAAQLQRVRDGDLLISDTPLPAEFLVQLLERAGLRLPAELAVGRHYPRGIFSPALGSPRDLRPLRLLEVVGDSTLLLDPNHPLAAAQARMILERASAPHRRLSESPIR